MKLRDQGELKLDEAFLWGAFYGFCMGLIVGGFFVARWGAQLAAMGW